MSALKKSQGNRKAFPGKCSIVREGLAGRYTPGVFTLSIRRWFCSVLSGDGVKGPLACLVEAKEEGHNSVVED